MTALLHYAWLKGMRDRSLPVFFAIAPIQIAAMIIGFAVIKRQVRYPLAALNFDEGDIAAITILLPSFVATLSAFWTFRSEVATRAINSFVMGSRPLAVVASLVVFGFATAMAGVAALIATAVILTATVPAAVASMAFTAAVASVAGASLGALYVTISPQPGMLVWTFVAGIPLVPFIFDPANRAELLTVGTVISLVAIGIATVLLRRRCAS
ncbi:MAG TPA: hypothetical protein VNA04_13450 [Thermoanaerobaculia bacterium]|nr:hypothetical protein [Thermoanaerobaculia bacterium]